LKNNIVRRIQLKIKTVTVIGANGSMGCYVSGIFASFGDAKVYMVCRTLDKAIAAVEKATASVKADSIKSNLIPKDFSDLENCLVESDLVFESVAEDFEIKAKINQQISKVVKDNTIITTGTSGLSINCLAEFLREDIRKNYIGLHFYNPPYSMILCEVIPSNYTDTCLKNELKKYAQTILRRTVVEVKDSPAFLGNRIGFQFINEALQYADKYKDYGGIDYIDAILGQFTGRSMPPLRTSDFVGLDVHKAIVDNIYSNTDDYAKETFILPSFAEQLIKEEKLGRKRGCGLYKSVVNEDGTKTIYVYDIAQKEYRECVKYSFFFAKNMISNLRTGNYAKAFEILKNNESTEAEICLTFLLKYVIYSLTITNLVGDSIQSADDVMATGFNWVPPLAVIDAFGGRDEFVKLVNCKLDRTFVNNLDVNGLLKGIPSTSSYDYRRYFKAKQ
jgi:3-hydroxyacyl-CoA dehydrogenase